MEVARAFPSNEIGRGQDGKDGVFRLRQSSDAALPFTFPSDVSVPPVPVAIRRPLLPFPNPFDSHLLFPNSKFLEETSYSP